jgi:rfaE bifunctional protein nucleotidyltransferase chain/domain
VITVLAHGCFDILHFGHFEHFWQARALGDRLIVSITSAKWVRIAKGEGHPAHTDAERLMMICNLRMVHQAYICDEPTAVRAIRYFRPSIFVKGTDYAARDINPVERAACDEVGARVVFTTTKKRSVSEMVGAFK